MKKPYASSHPPVVVEQEVLTSEPLDICAALSFVSDPKAGAVVLFSGEVRNHSHGKQVCRLEYEAYAPMAAKVIRAVVEEAKTQYKLHQALCVHRVGAVEVGESAVLVITCSSHREEAYKANRYIIDRVKHEAPIWKKEYFEDGTSEWGHNCSCNKHYPQQ